MRSVLCAAVLVAAVVAPAHAKLPPLSDEAKAKAAEASARTGWADKVGAYKLCQSMDRVADNYRRTSATSGKVAAAPVAVPACADPGPFTPVTSIADKPIEASGAHSPAGTATSPPSTNATAAELDKTKK